MKRFLRPSLFAAALALAAGAAWLLIAHRPRPAPPAAEAKPLSPIVLEGDKRDLESYLQPDVAAALGYDPKVSLQQRLDLLRELRGADLGSPECEAMLIALMEPPGGGWEGHGHSEFFHEVALVLQRQAKVREKFARVLATIAMDPERDATLRDYSTQHLTRVWAEAGEDAGLRGSIAATCRALVAADAVIGSSALLSLHVLKSPSGGAGDPGRPLVPDEDLLPFVAGILKSPPGPDTLAARLVALRIVGERRLARPLPEVRKIAADPAAEHALARMAAVSALSRFGDPADKPFLESLDRQDPRVAGAVDHALSLYH